MNRLERARSQPIRHAAAFAAKRLVRVSLFAIVAILLLLYGGRIFAPSVELQVREGVRQQWERMVGR